uniref:NADH-ubiquinone oxidoreductase chain 6 n=1 Tax=Epuraea guttata TaxID=1903846 RepID=A0A343C1H4_9CUCU|nr:NADH dehydrogenase subunit 6 [Epuraea guttata]
MTNFLLATSCLLSMIFLFLNHPLSFGIILLFQTILVSLISGMLSYNFWFSYILFLVMIGGMLILFIYMTSIAANKKFKFSLKLFTMIMILIIMLFLFMFIDQYLLNNLYTSYDTIMMNMNMNNKFSLIKFLNKPNLILMLMTFNYLFIVLVAVTKISHIEKGPLRQKF